jgi:hypothetical protein
VASGASLIGLYDDSMTNVSAKTTVQDAIKQLDSAIGSGASKWTDSGTVTYLTSVTDDLAIGGTGLSDSIFSIDESTGVFLFGGDQSINPLLTFEAVDSDTGSFGLDQIASQCLITA